MPTKERDRIRRWRDRRLYTMIPTSRKILQVLFWDYHNGALWLAYTKRRREGDGLTTPCWCILKGIAPLGQSVSYGVPSHAGTSIDYNNKPFERQVFHQRHLRTPCKQRLITTRRGHVQTFRRPTSASWSSYNRHCWETS